MPPSVDTRLFIASQVLTSGTSLEVHDPWSGELLASVTQADLEHAELAAEADLLD